MNELLLEKLAEKLGVTAEYLWNILLEQAFIGAVIDSFSVAVVILALCILHRLVKNIEDTDYKIIASIVLGAIGMIFMVFLPIILSSTVNGFVHPEYWALNKLLSFR